VKAKPLSTAEASALVAELRAMALRPPGHDEPVLRRAKEITFQLAALPSQTGRLAGATKHAYGLLEILLSHRRWKTEAVTVEALRKDIKSACDRLRVAVEAAFAAPGSRS
jgi:hypothetical protein